MFVCGTSATLGDKRHKSLRSLKGAPMAVSVLLSLSDAVSVPDLKHFLSLVPEGFDDAEDLRMHPDDDGTAHFLEIPLPLPAEL